MNIADRWPKGSHALPTVLDLDHWLLELVSNFVLRDSNFISMDDSLDPGFPLFLAKNAGHAKFF